MKNKDYYALINFRGRIKYYYVSENLRIEHIDYKPERYNFTWINNGKYRIVKKFEIGSEEYKYFTSLKNEVNRLIKILAINEFNKSEDKTLSDIFYYSGIGSYYIKKAYKEAYKNIPKPEILILKFNLNMKNIHILPTEKPSRLWLSTRKENYLIFDKFPRGGVEYVEPKNIYITSEKDIKDNDWIITKDGRLVQVSYLLSKELDNASKIILTTDQDLIKDGVQAIDDEFLEWFVKNPSCEFINVDEKTPDEIEVELNIHGHDIGLTDREFDEWLNNGGQLYKIIIPKERQKQYIIDMMNADEEIGLYEELKQETLEEAAEKYSLELLEAKTIQPHEKTWIKSMFIHIAKWQQERMYSEEEIINALHSVELRDNKDYSKIYIGMKECFEQYKKHGKN